MKYVVVNLKMNVLTKTAIDTYCSALIASYSRARLTGDVQIVVCPSAPHYDTVFARVSKHKWLSLGAQTVFWQTKGAFTGEISPRTLRDSGAEYVLIGHSERRHIGHVSGEEVGKKVRAALDARLTPIVLVGEESPDHDAGRTKKVLTEQLLEAFATVADYELSGCILAYEPVWAVGAGRTPSIDEIAAARIILRKVLLEKYRVDAAREMPILYGGSVSDRNVSEIVKQADLQGVVVGTAALDPACLVRIAYNCV